MTRTATVVTEHDIAHLPEAAQRYLRFTGVLGRPRDSGFELHALGWFRRKPTDHWTACRVEQRNTAPDISRDFHLYLNLAHVLPVHAIDTYDHRHGHLHATALGTFTVADATGPEMDRAEHVTYLDDAILLAPSTLLDLPSPGPPSTTTPSTPPSPTRTSRSPPASPPTTAAHPARSPPTTTGPTCPPA
jgi:hypothetical protein